MDNYSHHVDQVRNVVDAMRNRNDHEFEVMNSCQINADDLPDLLQRMPYIPAPVSTQEEELEFRIKKVIELYNIKLKVLEALNHKVHIDESRELFVSAFIGSIFELLHGGRDDCGGHHLLLGRKGVGKTQLLTQLLKLVPLVFSEFRDKLVCFTLTWDAAHKADTAKQLQLPSERLVDEIRAKVGNEESLRTDSVWKFDGKRAIDHAVHLLEHFGLYAVFVIDELQTAYLSSCTNGAAAIWELFGIGNKEAPRMHVAGTGSMVHLRSLCFGKFDMTDDIKLKYPHYAKLSLNDRKFTPFTISPMLRQVDFAKTCAKYFRRPTAEFFLQTGGVPDFVRHPWKVEASSFTLSTKAELSNEKRRKILIDLAERVRQLEQTEANRKPLLAATEQGDTDAENDRESEWCTPFWFVRCVPMSNALTFTAQFDDRNELYELADAGMLQYRKTWRSYDGVPAGTTIIGFGSPLCYLESSQRGDMVDFREVCEALLNPFGVHQEKAETLMLSYLQDAAQRNADVFGFLLDNTAGQVVSIHLNACGNRLNEILRPKRLYKETTALNDGKKDKHGADGFVLTPSASSLSVDCNAQCYDLHRVQIKLAATDYAHLMQKGGNNAMELVQALENGKADIESRFADCGFKIAKHYWYLVTNRIVTKDARTVLHEKVTTIDRQRLSDLGVWPDDIKRLGPRFRP